jgi:hypothetical protein
MGGSNSKTVMDIDTKVLNETIFNYTQTNQTEQTQSGTVSMSINLDGAEFKSCTANIMQSGEMEATAIQLFTSSSATQLANDVQNQIESDLTNQADQSSGWLSTSIAETKENSTIVKSEIKNIVDTNLNYETLNTQIQNLKMELELNSTNVIFDPCGYGNYPQGAPEFAVLACQECESVTTKADGSSTRINCNLPVCTVDQTAAMKLFAQQTSDNIVKAIQENTTLNDIAQEVAMKTDQSTQGLGGAIGEIMSGAMIPFIISGVVMVIAIIAFVMLKPKKMGRGGVEFGN